MFSTKKTDGVPFGVSTVHPPASQSIPASSNTNASTHSIVDECLTMKGDLESEGNIIVKGKVFGNIGCEVLIIDKDASVEGGVDAKEVVIRGKANGKIQANRVRLEKTADVDSEICHDTFAAEEGARVKGNLRLNGEPPGRQTETVAAKDDGRNKSVSRSTKQIARGQAEEAGASGT